MDEVRRGGARFTLCLPVRQEAVGGAGATTLMLCGRFRGGDGKVEYLEEGIA